MSRISDTTRLSGFPVHSSIKNFLNSMAMAQGLKVSAFPKIVVTARVSKSGGAKPAPGDLQGASAPVANDAAGVKVLIDSVVP